MTAGMRPSRSRRGLRAYMPMPRPSSPTPEKNSPSTPGAYGVGDGSAVDGGGSTTGIVGSGVPSGAEGDGEAGATGEVGGAAGVAVEVTVGLGDRSDVDVVPPRAGGAPGGAVPRLPEPEGANAGGGVRPAQIQPAHTASGSPSIT